MKFLLQYFLPRLIITHIFGWLAEIRIVWIKNYFIRRYIRKYYIDLSIAEPDDINKYDCFNAFFARKLKKQSRPINADKEALVSPVDGYLYHYGKIQDNPIFSAKGFEFSLETLLVQPNYTKLFSEGNFFCMYLSPNDYHRVHTPLTARLLEMTYIPGDYYSVAPTILAKIPGIFAKNERLVCLFETEVGPMAYVMVGAMCVSSIHTVWAGRVNQERNGKIIQTDYRQENIIFQKGDEIGHFQMGSTVMLFFAKDTISFNSELNSGQHCLIGEKLAKTNIISNSEIMADQS